jgi:hypothetical protein
MVVIFCNRVLKLDTGIIESGDLEQKKLHLMSALSEFLWPRVEKVIEQITPENLEGLRNYTEDEDITPLSQDSDEAPDLDIMDLPQISQSEVEEFAQSELNQIDDGDTFHRFFG